MQRRESFDIATVKLTDTHKVIDVSVSYQKGVRSWGSGELGRQGIHIGTTTCEKSSGMSSIDLFGDTHLKTLVVPSERFNAKKLEEVASELKANGEKSLLYGEAYKAIIEETAKRGGHTIATSEEEAYKIEAFTVGNRVKLTQPKSTTKPVLWTGVIVGVEGKYYQVADDDFWFHQYVKAVDHTQILERTGEPDWTPEQVQAMLDQVRTEETKREQASEDKKQKRESEIASHVAALTAQYPYAKSEGHGYARASANLKRELQIAFPQIAWSVKSDSFSMGDSVTVSWTDGPTEKQINEIADKYERGKFNGMIDMYENDRSAYGEAVDVVLGRSKYVSTSRSYSPEAKETIEAHPQIVDEKNSVYTILCASEIFSTEFERFDKNELGYTIAVFKKPEPSAIPETNGNGSNGDGGAVLVRQNAEKGGVEIKFQEKPEPEVIASVKARGFRWSKYQKLWYAKATDDRIRFANRLSV